MTAIQNGEYINASDGHAIHPEGRNSRMAEPRSADWKSGLRVLRSWCEMMMIKAWLRAGDGPQPDQGVRPI
jgi:hypothetical protein